MFGEITFDLTDSWSVTGGARWFEYDRHEIESDEVPAGLPVFDERSAGSGNFVFAEPITSEGTDDDVVMKFATQYKFDDEQDAVCALQPGLPPGRQEQRARRAGRAGAASTTSRTRWIITSSASSRSGSTTALLVNVSAFLMEWSDIQLSGDTSAIDPWWLRGTFNGGKAEQKGVELQVEWQRERPIVARGRRVQGRSRILGVVHHPGRRSGRRGLADAGLSRGEVVGRGRIPRARLPGPGRRVLRPHVIQLSGRVLEQPYRDPLRQPSRLPRPHCRLDPDDLADALDQVVPSYSTSTLQFGVSTNSGWDAALIVRNLFDEKPRRLPELGRLRRRASAIRGSATGTTPQRPRTISLSFTKRW